MALDLTIGNVASNLPNYSSTSPVGVKAVAPTTNLTPPTNTLAPAQIAPKDISRTYANVGGTIYNTQSGTKFATPTDFFKDSGQTSFDNLKFYTNYTPTGKETIYGSAGIPTTQPNQAPQPTPATLVSAPVNQDPYSGLYAALIASLAAKSATSNDAYNAANTKLTDLAQQQSALQSDLATQTGDINSRPEGLSQQTGQQGILNQLYASKQAALAPQYSAAEAQLGAANTQQQIQQQGLQGAAQLAQPVGQFGLLTNPITGTPLNTQVFLGAVQQAQQLVKNGTPADSQAVQSLLSPFGFVGQLGFNNAMQLAQGSGWNPAAQSAATGQNITFGQQTQAGAQNVSLALQQVGTLTPLITNFMSAAGINPNDNSKLNEQISTYMSTIKDPGAIAQYSTLINELQRFSSQLIGTGSLTPTGVTQATQLQNPQNLSVNQIKSYLQTLSDAGNNQLYNLQSQTTNAYGGNAGQYTGTPTTPITNTTPASPTTIQGTTKDLGAVAGGTGINLVGWVGSEINKLGSAIMGWIGGKLF